MTGDEPVICYMGHVDCYDSHTVEQLTDGVDWQEDWEREEDLYIMRRLEENYVRRHHS